MAAVTLKLSRHIRWKPSFMSSTQISHRYRNTIDVQRGFRGHRADVDQRNAPAFARCNDLRRGRLRASEEIAGLILGEEGGMVHGYQSRAEIAGKRHLDDGDHQPAIGYVMNGGDLAAIDEFSN